MTASPLPAVSPASLGRRVGAYVIDAAIATAIALVLVGLYVALLWGRVLARDSSGVFLWAMLGWLLIALGMLGWWLAYSAMQGGRGSIGQRALGLRLQDADSGEPIGFWRAVLRNLVFNLAASVVVGYFTPLFDAGVKRQGWHDMAARTAVVGVRGTDAAPAPAGPPRGGMAPAYPGWPAPAAPAGYGPASTSRAAPPMHPYGAATAQRAPISAPAYAAPAHPPAYAAPARPAYTAAPAPAYTPPPSAPAHFAPQPTPPAAHPVPHPADAPAVAPASAPIAAATPAAPPAPAPEPELVSVPAPAPVAPSAPARAPEPSLVGAPAPAPASAVPASIASRPAATVTLPYPPADLTEPLEAAAAHRSATAPTAPTTTVTANDQPAAAPQASAPTVAIPVVPATAPVGAAAHASAGIPLFPGAVATPVAVDVDDTRAASVPFPAERADRPLAVLTWDDGTRMAAYGRTLYGRNPAAEPGAAVVAVRDETLSLSKTHFEIGADDNGPWVRDRHSTNGTVLLRDGGRFPLVPGLPTTVRAGDRLEFGDRSATLGAV